MIIKIDGRTALVAAFLMLLSPVTTVLVSYQVEQSREAKVVSRAMAKETAIQTLAQTAAHKQRHLELSRELMAAPEDPNCWLLDEVTLACKPKPSTAYRN